MSSIRWLGLKRERRIFDLCLQHSRRTQEAAELLKTAITDLCDQKYDELEGIAEKIVRMAREGDKTAREARRTIGHTSSDIPQRQDLLDLLFHLETVADAVEASAYRMEMAEGLVVPKKLAPMLKGLVDAVIQTCLALTQALEKMAYDWRSAADQAEHIRTWESRVDSIRREAMKYLISIADDMGISAFWRVEEIIKHLEDAADATEATANVINLIIASRYE